MPDDTRIDAAARLGRAQALIADVVAAADDEATAVLNKSVGARYIPLTDAHLDRLRNWLDDDDSDQPQGPRVRLTEDVYGVRSQSPYQVVDIPAGTIAVDTGTVWRDPLTGIHHQGYRMLVADTTADGYGATAIPAMPGFYEEIN